MIKLMLKLSWSDYMQDYVFFDDKDVLITKEMEQEIKGNNLFIYIDDTGSGGNNAPNQMLANNTKSYIGVVCDSEQKRNVVKELQSLLFSLKKDNKNECHFVDIYNRQGDFKDIDTNDVIGFFNYFSNLINKYEIPFFIQSCDITSKQKLNCILKENMNLLKEKKLTNINYEFGIILMLLRQIERKLIDNELYYDNVYITIDEGIFKKDTNLLLLGDLFSKVSNNAYIRFKSSKEDVLLQVSDYLAYSYLRIQYLNKKILNNSEKFFNDEFYKSIYESILKSFDFCISDDFKMIEINNESDIDKINKKPY